jgi:RNA polymerase sigma-70 factor (ECF subfamily)
MLLEGLRDAGNEGAWREFCVRYEPALFALARRAGLQDPDAHDVIQDTLVVFLEGYRQGRYDRGRGRLRAWLKGIVLNKIREARRRIAKPEIHIVDKTDTTGFMNRVPDDQELKDAFDEEWERHVLAECLREVRQHVDGQTFRAFQLYAMDDWPPEKVAEHLGVSRNAVYISKSRVLARLRALQQQMAELW